MILNEEEKNQLIEFLKKQYNTNKEKFDNNDLDWIKDDKTREEYIKYVKKLKEKYEALESKEQVETSFPLFDINKNDDWGGWAGIVGLVALAVLFGGNCGNLVDNIDTDKKDLN